MLRLVLLLALSGIIVMSQEIRNLRGEYRNGQVFLQWEEHALPQDATLQVWASDSPFNGSETEKTLLAKDIQPGSGRDWWQDPAAFFKDAEPATPVGFVIQDGGQALNPANGLHVHTIPRSGDGERYYAVTWHSDNDAAEQTFRSGMNCLSSALAVKFEQVVPISLQSPALKRGDGLGKALVFAFHGRGGGAGADKTTGQTTGTHLWFADSNQGWREGLPFKFNLSISENEVRITPFDRTWINRPLRESKDSRDHVPAVCSFWSGYNTNIAKSNNTAEIEVDIYIERYLLALIDWAQNWLGTDSNRCYLTGGSMGGSAGISLGLHYPERFAAIHAMVPVYRYTWEECSTSKAVSAGRLACACGPLQDRPAKMKTSGQDFLEYMDGAKNINRPQVDAPPIFATNGRRDASIPWVNNPPFYQAANAARQAFAVFWNDGPHGMSSSAPADVKNWSNYLFKYRLDQSYPAFSNCSDNKDYGNGAPEDGDIVGWINRGLDWAEIKDTRWEYSIELSAEHPDISYPVSTDVTLRRLQQFRVHPGEVLQVKIGSDEEISHLVPADGLLTIRGIKFVDAKPVSLTIRRPPEAGKISIPASERPRRPYADLDWTSTLLVKSTSHVHITSNKRVREALAVGLDFLTISNYYPSAPYYPWAKFTPNYYVFHQQHPIIDKDWQQVDGPFDWSSIVSQWKDTLPAELQKRLPFKEAAPFDPLPDGILEAPNAEHHSFRDSSAHINSPGSMHCSGHFDARNKYQVSSNRGWPVGNRRYWRDAFDAMFAELLYAAGGGVTINHPHWSNLPIRTALAMLDYDARVLGIEVYNHSAEVGRKTGWSEKYWDSILSTGRQCFGFFVPDWYFSPEDGCAMNVLLVKERTAEACLQAYRQGNWFGCLKGTGLSFRSISFDGKILAAKIDRPASLKVISRQGVIKESTGQEISLVLSEEEYPQHVFLRLTASDETGESIYSQPLLL